MKAILLISFAVIGVLGAVNGDTSNEDMSNEYQFRSVGVMRGAQGDSGVISVLRDAFEYLVNRCKSSEAPKKLNLAFFKSMGCFTNVFDIYGFNENLTEIENLKILRNQVCSKRSEVRQCSDNFFDVVQAESCATELEIDAFKGYKKLGLALICDDELFNAALAGSRGSFKCGWTPEFEAFIEHFESYTKGISKKLSRMSVEEQMDYMILYMVQRKECDLIDAMRRVEDLKNIKVCKNFVKMFERAIKIAEPRCDKN